MIIASRSVKELSEQEAAFLFVFMHDGRPPADEGTSPTAHNPGG
jgi:hypothetical protein